MSRSQQIGQGREWDPPFTVFAVRFRNEAGPARRDRRFKDSSSDPIRTRSIQPNGPDWAMGKEQPRKDSNLDKENQNLLCYRYTTELSGLLSGFPVESSRPAVFFCLRRPGANRASTSGAFLPIVAGFRPTLSMKSQSLLAAAAFALLASSLPAEEGEWISLFDGKTLNGWKHSTRHRGIHRRRRDDPRKNRRWQPEFLPPQRRTIR